MELAVDADLGGLALRTGAGSSGAAAKLLGVSLRTHYRRCDELGIKPKGFRPARGNLPARSCGVPLN